MESNNPLQGLIGDKLLVRQGEEGNHSIAEIPFDEFYQNQIAGKCDFLCFYYGAHWAPPSRLFTQTLIEKFYSVVNSEKKTAEVIFVTDDR